MRTRGIRMVCKAGALEKVLLLARSVLRADLLAIDALHREALVIFCKPVSMSDVRQAAIAECKYRWAASPFARNSTNAACTS